MNSQLYRLKSFNSFIRERAARFAVVFTAIFIGACTSTSDATFTTAKNIFPFLAQTPPSPSDPNFIYLRVQIESRTALLVLGEIDPHPEGPIESFYSAEAEVLKFQNGRIVATAGLTTNWVKVTHKPTAQGYQRVRDVMPGYRFGLAETLVVQTLRQPPREIRAAGGLTKETINRLSWEEERAVSGQALPRTVIGYEQQANGQRIPKVGYQCLDDGICIQWERL